MARFAFLTALAAAGAANAYWLMGINNAITRERIDPITNPGEISAHNHFIVGSSGFRTDTNSEKMRASTCTSIPIEQDHSNYWVPDLWFNWKNGSVTSVGGGMVIYYLFDADGKAKPFPENFRSLSGDPKLRTYDPNSKAQQAITFLCLDFNGETTRHNELPKKKCPSGIRSQVNFPMCWDGKNADSPDHQSHVAFPSGGADKGTCNDPNFPVTLPRIFIEVYWDTGSFNALSSQAANPEQPFVFSNGDPTGYGYHGDFMNGWDRATLERAIAPDGCTCDIYGGFDCCVNKGIFKKNTEECRITPTFAEATSGTLPKLPGNNPIGTDPGNMIVDKSPERYAEIIEYRGKVPPRTSNVIPGSGGDSPSGPAPEPVSPSSFPSSGAPPAPSASAPVVPPAPSNSPPSLSAPSNPPPAPSAPAPAPSAPAPPSVPSGGSDPYPGQPKPSNVPSVSSRIFVNLPGGASSTVSSGPSTPTKNVGTNPPYGNHPRPPHHPVNNGSNHGGHHHEHEHGSCSGEKKTRRSTHHRRRLTNSY